MRKLLMMAAMAVLCACGIAQEEAAGAAAREPSIEELCKILEEKFDDPGAVDFIMGRFCFLDGRDLTSYGNQEALGWARKVVSSGDKRFNMHPAREYLMRKGGAGDLDIIGSSGFGSVLAKRVAGVNVINYHPFLTFHEPHWLGCIPSVTNTGPQGGYVADILRQYWENMEAETRVLGDGIPRPFKDKSKIPHELQTLVVWFDDDGNPVCNVDLAKHGLTMPEIDVPNRPKGKEKLGIRNEELGMGDEKSATRRLGPYALILPAALAALLLVRRRRR